MERFDVRTASIEDISKVFGISPQQARTMQLMERGEYHGDTQMMQLYELQNPKPTFWMRVTKWLDRVTK